ncbi:MAG: type ISP restriction/modification enzyme, partial [Flavobacterium sp.]|uniref:type ISP restriction/modification enzyme n=1 Tax=Flavobacterium sp. TaxID=239 RepID=UPI003BC80809
TLLVKNPDVKTEKATIHYQDIGEYLTREEKLKIISGFKSFTNEQLQLKTLQPNEQGDWLSMRNDAFENFIALDPEKKLSIKSNSFFVINSNGVVTNRDNWVYNSSQKGLIENVKSMISFYNSQVEGFKKQKEFNNKVDINSFISKDETKIKWVQNLIRDAGNGIVHTYDEASVRKSSYRPFYKQNLYFNKSLNWSRYLMPSILPTEKHENFIICVSGIGASKGYSALITSSIPNLHYLDTMQSFPLYYYEENNAKQRGMFDEDNKNDFIRRDAISDFILERAKKIYGKNVTKEDIFYYVYGFLHSNQYKEKFASDLKKMLPRLPLLEEVKDFWAFSKAGRKLAELHLNYETVAPFADAEVTGDDGKFYTVEKLRFPKKDQKDTIIYNSKITISNIPAQAYQYVVNGKSAIEWIMERYQISTHKESGITNNPNDWATETGNPRYILDLLLSVINVSVQTVEIVNSLPKVDFGTESRDSNEIKMYTVNEDDVELNIAAEPNE